MLKPDSFLIAFAQVVELLRTRPNAKDEQKTAFRALIALCQLSQVRIAVDGDTLEVQGTPVPDRLPFIPSLMVQLREHGVTAIDIVEAVSPGDLFGLVRELASRPGESRLESVGGGVTVTRLPESTEAHGVGEATIAAAGVGGRLSTMDTGVFLSDFTGASKVSAQSSLDTARQALSAQPYEGDVLSRLSPLAIQTEDALAHDRLEDALETIDLMVRLEVDAPEETSKRAYAIVLRRVLTRKHLGRLAPTLTDKRCEDGAKRVFVRGGDVAIDVLLPLVEQAGDAGECHALLEPLRVLRPDALAMAPLLTSPKWFVASGVASLFSGLEDRSSVDFLAQGLSHADNRVQEATLTSLVRIGNAPAIEHVRHALASGDPALQSAVANAVQGRRSAGLTMTLAMTAEAEGVNPTVRRELYEALGRIGTHDALRVLIQAAQPGGRVVGRKSGEQRLAAVNGLRQAGAGAREHLEKLTRDRDKAVAAASAQALADARA